MIVKVAHVRLCHSRMLFVRAYPRETQEMVFDAHDHAFALFKGDLWTRRQHEDRGRQGLRRQEPPRQSPLPADVQPLPVEPVACAPRRSRDIFGKFVAGAVGYL
jgi:transposase